MNELLLKPRGTEPLCDICGGILLWVLNAGQYGCPECDALKGKVGCCGHRDDGIYLDAVTGKYVALRTTRTDWDTYERSRGGLDEISMSDRIQQLEDDQWRLRHEILIRRVLHTLEGTVRLRSLDVDAPDPEAHVLVDFTDKSAQVIAPLVEAVDLLESIIWASDGCQGHRGCVHSMEPWQRARALLASKCGRPTWGRGGGCEVAAPYVAPRPRIKTREDALRCFDAVKQYLRRHEGQLAAEDLEDSIAILFQGQPEQK